jgi:short-subunit dehydrogenase
MLLNNRNPSGEPAGKRVLITGGSSGIGLTVARSLDGTGARVVLLARGAQGLAEAAQTLENCAGTIAADVTDADAIASAVSEASGLLGGLDVVVACAGAGAYGPFLEMAPEDWQRTVAITLVGLMNTAHAAIPELELAEGTLVVIGSVAGRLPTPWLAAYTAAKHGVRGFLRSLDTELRAQRRPVSLALVAPGPVDTPFWQRARTPDGRLPPEIAGAYRPEDVANEVLRAIADPRRLERTVGGLFAAVAFVDSLIPNRVLAPLGLLARLGWRAREQRPVSDDDALSQPTSSAHREGGLASRGSGLQQARDLGSSRP